MNKRSWLRAVLVFGLICAWGPAPVIAMGSEAELLSTSQQAFDDGFHDVAIRYLEEFLNEYPRSAKMDQARLLLGECYFFRNNFDKALEQFNAVNASAESQDMLLYWTAETHLKLSNPAEAQKHYLELIKSFPQSPYLPQALYSMGWLYFDQKQYNPAKLYFSKLVTAFPKNQLVQDSRLKIGECLYNLGEYGAAIKQFQNFLESYPQNPQASEIRLNIADAYYYKDDYIQAMDTYDRVVRTSSDPQEVQAAHVGRIWSAIKKRMFDQAERFVKDAMEYSKTKQLPTEGLILAAGHLSYERGDFANAVLAYDLMLKNYPTGSHRQEAALGKANAYYGLKKYDRAAENFKLVLDRRRLDSDPEVAVKANLGLGWAYVKLGEWQKGIKSFQDVFENAPSQDTKINALAQMADAYNDAGRFSEAMSIYDNIQKSYPSSQWGDYILYRQGVAYLKTEKIDEAQAAFDRLQKSFPDTKYLDDLNYYQGIIQFKKGRWGESVARMEAFIKALTHPSEFSPEANYILALSYLNLKQYDEALKVFQKILRLYPEDETVAKNSDIGIAKCQFEAGQLKEALKRFKLIVYKYPRTDVEKEALLWLAQYSMKNSQYENAVAYYRQILDHFSGEPADQIHYELAQAYDVLGETDKSLSHYKAVSEKDSALHSKVKLAIASIFSKEFDPQKALSAYQNIANTNPEYARDAYVKMAQLYRNGQNYESEIRTYEKAMKIGQGKSSVGNAELLFNIGDAFEATNHNEEAVDNYLKVPLQYPDQSDWVVKAYLRVAKIFEDRKDWEGAAVTYRKIVQLNTEESKYAQERLDSIKRK